MKTKIDIKKYWGIKLEKTNNIQKNKTQIWYKNQMSMDEIKK
jgi:hypothetical protein